jgi:disulfide bond formation protein DsbB
MTDKQLAAVQPLIWILIFLQALVATFGSLYFSTFGDIAANMAAGNVFALNGLMPCELCWFARILMYPLLFISYVGIAKKDRHFTDFMIPMVALGIPLEIYHYAIQKLPIGTIFGCSLENPCNALQVNYFGFITIPFMALAAFVILGVLIGLNTSINRRLDKISDSEA